MSIYFTFMTYSGCDWQFIGAHFSLCSYRTHYSASSHVAVVRMTVVHAMHHPSKLVDSILSPQKSYYFGHIYVMNNKCYFELINTELVIRFAY